MLGGLPFATRSRASTPVATPEAISSAVLDIIPSWSGFWPAQHRTRAFGQELTIESGGNSMFLGERRRVGEGDKTIGKTVGLNKNSVRNTIAKFHLMEAEAANTSASSRGPDRR
jgi:hypothetical protein